jgi:hypothetical protein
MISQRMLINIAALVHSQEGQKEVPSKEWDSIHKVLKRAEYALDMYMDIDIIRHISCARSRVNFKTMEASPTSSHTKLAHYTMDLVLELMFT